jgi:hypothetical protein
MISLSGAIHLSSQDNSRPSSGLSRTLDCRLGWLRVQHFLRQPESLYLAPISKTDVPSDVIVKTREMAQWRGVDRDKSAITHEMTRTSVKDHDPTKFQIAVSLALHSVGKEIGSLHGVDKFRPMILRLPRNIFDVSTTRYTGFAPKF